MIRQLLGVLLIFSELRCYYGFFYIALQLPVSVIAKTLSLSYKSVYADAVKKHELNFHHSSITDEELDIIVCGILQK